LRLFPRLTTTTNDHLQTMMRYHGLLSFYIRRGVEGGRLDAIELNSTESGRGRGRRITAVISYSANDRLRSVAEQRGGIDRARPQTALLRERLEGKHGA
jgi:hypothetical protein